jgi:hypothetical protein
MSIAGFLFHVARGEGPASDGRQGFAVSLIRSLALSIALSASASAVQASIVVRAVYEAAGGPVAAGVNVYVDGKKIGATGANGRYVISSLPAGTHLVGAVSPGLAGGAAQIVVNDPAQDKGVDVVLTGEGLASVVPAALESSSLPILPLTSTGFTASIVDPASGHPLPVSAVSSVTVERTVTGEIFDLTAQFEIVNGHILRFAAPGGINLAQFLNVDSRHVLKVEALTAEGALMRATRDFWIGRSKISGQLLPPGSNSAVPVSNVLVTLDFLGAGVSVSTRSDQNGRFTFASVPALNVAFSAQRLFNGTIYSGAGVAFVDRNVQARLRLLGPAEHRAGGSPITIIPAASPGVPTVSATDAAEHARRLEAEKALGARAEPAELPAATGQVSISATSGQQDARIAQTATLTVPKGTASVTLSYSVVSREYPFYVLNQSTYNDNWDLSVISGQGRVLFQIARNVNSQTSLEPLWRCGGTTGLVTEKIDVSALTRTGEATLILTGSAMNVGDSVLATTVQATLGTPPDELRAKILGVYEQIPGTEDFFSIPPKDRPNTYRKGFDFKIEPPYDLSSARIESVKAEIGFGTAGSVDATVFEGKATAVGSDAFRVFVTFGKGNPILSPFVGAPPPAHNMCYRFTINAKVAGVAKTLQLDSPLVHAFWTLPATIARYGQREPGGDGWTSKGGYEWLTANAGLLSRVDDISGEHGRSLGSAGHEDGAAIDISHYTPVDSSSGLKNYLALKALALRVLDGDSSARSRLAAWARAQRTGLSNLAALSSVAEVRTVFGAAAPGLQSGWLWSVLRFGAIASNGGIIPVDDGFVLNQKIRPAAGNDLRHLIVLNRKQLANTP